jgi:hypothetical protein
MEKLAAYKAPIKLNYGELDAVSVCSRNREHIRMHGNSDTESANLAIKHNKFDQRIYRPWDF